MAGYKGRDAHKKEMQLLEARKAGLAQPELDEDGKAINPHIPKYMVDAPWYLAAEQPSLKHQRNWRAADNRQDSSAAAAAAAMGGAEMKRRGYAATEDEFARPSAKRAKGGDAAAAPGEDNETVRLEKEENKANLGAWERKRDQYATYDAADYARVAERYERVEELRTDEQRRKALESKLGDGADDAKAADDEATGFGQVERRVRSAGGGSTGTVRNLRIREDTAKYLMNLDTNSAYYDPKTRSMREDPTPWLDASQKTFAGDNFVRGTGDAAAFAAMQQHALATTADDAALNVQALPSAAEALYKEYQKKKEALVGKRGEDVRATYGDASANAERPDMSLLVGQTEIERHYDRSGRVVSGGPARVVKSRYREDVFANNHTSVFGSFWCPKTSRWGYKCCGQFVKGSWCVANAAGGGGGGAEDEWSMQAMMERARKAAEEQRHISEEAAAAGGER